jgi:hypothetical protein
MQQDAAVQQYEMMQAGEGTLHSAICKFINPIMNNEDDLQGRRKSVMYLFIKMKMSVV